MKALCIIGGIALLIFIILMIRIRVNLGYRDDLFFNLKLGPFRINLEKFKKKKKKKKKASTESTEASDSTKKQKDKKKSSVGEIIKAVLDIVEILKEYLGNHQKSVRLDASRFNISIATGDAASTALECAAVQNAVGLLCEFISSYATIGKRTSENINIVPDFTGTQSECDIDITLSMRIFSVLRIAGCLLINYIKNEIEKEKSKAEKGTKK